MQGKALWYSLFGIFFGICFSAEVSAQCIVINEIMINPSNSNDGNNMPNTAEWVEIYNTCPTPVNIGCYFIFDGDWSATIPGGTMIGPNDFFVIGSSNSGGTVDLNIATCNCTSGQSSQIGVFSNSDEQIGLLDASGTYIDGIYWGSGQFSNANFSVAAEGACSAHTVNVSASNPIWVQASANTLTTDGSFLARACDGSDTWQVLTSGSTIGATNSSAAPAAAFTASETTICAGDCITFTDQSTGLPDDWEWTFTGSNTPTFSGQIPPSICYPNAGTYSVGLTIANGCGNDDLTIAGYIQVGNTPVPTITANGPLVMCEGSSVQLSTTAVGTLQWYADGAPVPGGNSSTLQVTQTGSYTVEVSNGVCTQESEPEDVLVLAVPSPNILSNNGNVLCEGQTVTLSVSGSFNSYAWTMDGAPIGTNSNTLSASEPGDYQVEVSNDACNAISAVFPLTVFPNPVVSLSPVEGVSICEGESTTLTASGGFPTYVWRKNSAIVGGTGANLVVSEAGTYSVEATDANGCSGSSNSVEVEVIAPQIPSIQIPDDVTLCEGETTILTVSASYLSYTWYLGSNVVTGANESLLVVDETGSYSIVTTDVNGCEGTSEPVAISVEDTPIVTVDPEGEVSTCALPFDLTAAASSGAGLWQWFESETPIPGANSATYSATLAGVYHAEYTSPAGCFGASEPTTLNVESTFDAEFQVSTEDPCEGETVVLSFNTTYPTIVWSDGSNDNELAVVESGTYSAIVTNALGCTAEVDTTIVFSPAPFIDAGDDLQSDCTGAVIPQVESNGTSFLWTPNLGVSNDTLLAPELNPSTTTLYTITATLGRCTSSDNVVVTTDCTWIYVPNAFTPDFDGVNDAFKVVGNGIAKFELTIFDRWGDQVYFSTDMNESWVGGKDAYFCPDGVYNYKLIALDANGVPVMGDSETFGSVLLIR